MKPQLIHEYRFRGRYFEVARCIMTRRFNPVTVPPYQHVSVHLHQLKARPDEVLVSATVIVPTRDDDEGELLARIALSEPSPGETLARFVFEPKPWRWRVRASVESQLAPETGQLGLAARQGRRAVLMWWWQSVPRWVEALEPPPSAARADEMPASAPAVPPASPVPPAPPAPEITDEIDRKILALVTKDPDLTDDQVGAQVGLSRGAVNTRRRSLQKLGYKVR